MATFRVLGNRLLPAVCCLAALLLVAQDAGAQNHGPKKPPSGSPEISAPSFYNLEKFSAKLRIEFKRRPYRRAAAFDSLIVPWSFARRRCSIPLMQGEHRAAAKGRVVAPKQPERFAGCFAHPPAPSCGGR